MFFGRWSARGARAAGFAAVLFTATPAVADFSLTLLHNNDGESQLINAGAGLTDFGGVARFKTLVDQLRSTAATNGVLTLSSGDNFLAGPEFNASLTDPGGKFYDALALGAIGYDAIIMGNHDFDFGPDVLADFIQGTGTNTPFLSANLDFSAEPSLNALVGSGRIAKSLIVTTGGQQVGIVGATTPDLPFISSPRNVVVNPDVAAVVQQQIDQLHAAGVNKVVLVSHLQSVAEDLALIPQLSGVDIAIAGGGDELLANAANPLVPDGTAVFGPYPLSAVGQDGATVPVITTAGDYKYLGRLEATFDDDGKLTAFTGGPVRVVDAASVAVVPEDFAVVPDATVLNDIVAPVQASIAGLSSNIIGHSEVALDGIRNNVRSRETNLGDLLTDSILWQAQELADAFGVPRPVVAFQNGGGIRNNALIPAGDLSELNTFDVAPFANFVSVVEDVSIEELLAVLENAVSQVETFNGRFAQIAGLEFTYNPNLAAGSRVQDVRLADGTLVVNNGVILDAELALSVATIDFLATGGDQYDFGDGEFTRMGVTYQQALAGYIGNELGGLVTAADYPLEGLGRITAVPEPGTAALAFAGLSILLAAPLRRSRLETPSPR